MAGKKQTGRVDAETAEVIGEMSTAGLTPEWFVHTLALGSVGEDVRAARERLGLWDDNRFEVDMEAAVRRLQSERQMAPTGVLDEQVARVLGD